MTTPDSTFITSFRSWLSSLGLRLSKDNLSQDATWLLAFKSWLKSSGLQGPVGPQGPQGGAGVPGSGTGYGFATLGDFMAVQTFFKKLGIIGSSDVPFLPADRLTKWQPGVTYNGGIPSRSTIFTTVNPTGVAATDVPAIQTAVNNCPVGQVVALGAGTFAFDGASNTTSGPIIINKGITVRGAGPGVTIINKTNGSHVQPGSGQGANPSAAFILGLGSFGFWTNGGPDAAGGNTATNNSGGANLASEGAHGAFSVTLVNSSGFSAGMIVILDELSNSQFVNETVTYNAAHGYQIWQAPDGKTTWKLHNPGIMFVDDDFNGGNSTTPGGFGDFIGTRLDRPHCEIKEIVSVVGNVVTFNAPIHGNYRTANTAQLTWYTDAPSTGNVAHVRYAGLEQMTLTGFDNNVISMNWAAYCWTQNVEWDVWLGQALSFTACFRCEGRRFFGHGATYPEPTSGAYQICFDHGSSDCLIEDAVSVLPNKVMVSRRSGAGCVVAYCHTDMGMIDYNASWIEIGVNGSHLVGCHHMLFEGNYGQNLDSDNTHGASVYHTFFRNWARGIRAPFVDPKPGAPSPAPNVDDASQSGNGPRRCAGCQDYTYWMSFVGNVLGASGQHSGWVYEQTSWTSGPGIWLLGWCSGFDNTTTIDPRVTDNSFAGHVIRDGNWDWLNSQQSWHNTPATFAIPNSMYLPNAGVSSPAFWGSNNWPWVDPSTGTTYTLPARARFLAWQSGGPNPAI